MTRDAGVVGQDQPLPAVAAGVDTAFTDLYRREVGRQVRRAALLLGGDAAANDVVHDAFAALYQRWQWIADPGPYLERTVANACRDRYRRSQRWQRLAPRLAEPDGAAPTDEILWDVIGRLPFNQPAVVVLRFYESLTEAEIAATLGCRPGSVGPWLHRALKALRAAVGDGGGDGGPNPDGRDVRTER